MKKMNKSPAMFVAFTMLAATPLLPSCSGSKDSSARIVDNGDVGFRLDIAGHDVNEIQWVITDSDGNQVQAGVIDSSVLTAADFPYNFSVENLPAGTGYTISLTAVSTDGVVACAGQATFDVIANSRTSVNVVLSCEVPGDNDGGVDVEVGLNICPLIESVVAAPDTANVGDSISLSAAASDRDAADVLSYSWTADGVDFASGDSASYTCDSAGVKQIVLTVTDGECPQSQSLSVTCTDDGGESTTTTTEEGGEEESTTTTTEEGGEEESTTEEAGEESSSSETGDGSYWGRGESCDSCVEQWCEPVFGVDVISLCPPTDTECRDIFECKLGDNEQNVVCNDSAAGSLGCYCGSLDTGACQINSNVADGVCKDLITASLGTEVNTEVIALFSNQDYGAGRASQAITCMNLFCADTCIDI